MLRMAALENDPSVEVCAFLKDETSICGQQVDFTYDRIIGLEYDYPELAAEYLCEVEDLSSLKKGHKTDKSRDLILPRRMASVIANALHFGGGGRAEGNCHSFGNAMSGDDARYMDSHAPFSEPEGVIASEPLELGEVGVVDWPGNNEEAVHTLIGLGRSISESLQIMSSRGELAIVPNATILGYYQRYNPDVTMSIYRLR
jgi:hypothetical protein